jgi:hypothetical protein
MLQVVCSGLQDRERLNTPVGAPSLQFYRSVIRRRTRWASQWRRVEFDNIADFGRRATVTLPILGELITRATLVVTLPDIYTPQVTAQAAAGVPVFPRWSWTNAVGHALCSTAEFTIGTEVIDTVDSRLCEVLDEQTTPVEHFDSSNRLLIRNPKDYTQYAAADTTYSAPPNQSVEIVFPFWWNRGPGPQALPIQALAKDRVQITVNFRTAQQLVYTDSRTATGTLPTFAGCPFVDADGTPTGAAMPTSWHFQDAYWIIEYVSLEDREAAAFRMADLQIPIEQHLAIPVIPTDGKSRVRIPLNQHGLVRDMTWVAQRVEAETYNAYFLFSRDISSGVPGEAPLWWPNARIPNWDFGDGYIRPAFVTRRSDPIVRAQMTIRGADRFDHEGPSMFRSLLPALNCGRCPLIDRYIYRYDFGFWPSGGLAETLYFHRDEVRGAANWDKLPNKELVLEFDTDDCDDWGWEVDTSQTARTYTGDVIRMVETDFATTTEGFRVTLVGAQPQQSPIHGHGAIVHATVDYQQIRRQPYFDSLIVRSNADGTAALVVRALPPVPAPPAYTWVAMAAGGGWGTNAGAKKGGHAGSVVEIGYRGGNVLRSHAASAGNLLGGGGGGYLPSAATVGAGVTAGTVAATTNLFVLSHQTTGGGGGGQLSGGDGFWGGGSGTEAGGGGGSYVARLPYVTNVESVGGVNSSANMTYNGLSAVVLTPLRRVRRRDTRKFNVYIWLTTYNMLRINGGRGGLMFAV